MIFPNRSIRPCIELRLKADGHGLPRAFRCLKPIEEKQKYKVFDNEFISSVQWSVTGRCNYRCRHCLLSLKHIEEIIDQMAQAGIYKISLTGGEPLVRKDFLNIVDAFAKRDITITSIYSYGSLINEALLQRGIKPIFYLSFDGLESHDFLRGIAGAGKAVQNALLLCKEKGFETQTDFYLYQGNKEELLASIEALSKWGCTSVKISSIEEL